MRVGDYVRTKKRGFQPPQIARIKSMNKDNGYHNQYYIELDHNLIPDYEFHIYEEDVEKSSPNIIDLIEVGDYVNGMEVTGIGGTRWDKKDLHCYCEHNGNENWKQVMIPAKDIKSIVTKEQFESMEYKVGVDKE